MSTSILRLPAVIARTGLRRSSIYLRIKQGDFRPVKLGPRAIGFLETEIDAWIEERGRARTKNSVSGC
ncbi:MAG: helix-turn-helix transcriptional regulator [Gammaproteobacteria bacterium]|uniref:helix-turn-helix transcriptional regulator n=1 Tax=Bradyrhizobium sp. TaxID=376 RepID=UPI003D11BF68